MSDKKLPDRVNPERREFLERLTKGAFVVPAVLSVMMLNQKLNLTTANAVSNATTVCLTPGALIATPNGDVRVMDMRPGMPVYTMDLEGNRIVAPVVLASRVTAPDTHTVCRVVLEDGRELYVSGVHPTADGRAIDDLAPGDRLDGSTVASVERVSYTGGHTFDLLPGGDTGYYRANGILIGSTLSPEAGFYTFAPAERETEARA
mgnify:CR=1 FL=1